MGTKTHELYVGDCTRIMANLKPESFDVVCADSPYSSAVVNGFKAPTSVKYQSNNALRAHKSFSGDNRDQRSFQFWVSVWTGYAFDLVRYGGAILSFCDYRNLAAMIDGIQSGGWTYAGVVPWIKKTSRPRRGWFRVSATEFVVVGTKGVQDVDAYGPHFVQGQPPTSSARKHAAQKPVDMIVDLISWRPDWLSILDPFAGSGTIFEAADQMKRKATGIEFDEGFAELAMDRAKKVRRK